MTAQQLDELPGTISSNMPRFQRIAFRYLHNREDAEDAVQDAMLRAFRHAHQFEGRSRLITWLVSIVIFSCLMSLRRRPKVQLLPLTKPVCDGMAVADFLRDPGPTPERIAEQRELLQLVRGMIGALPDSQRVPLELCARKGYGATEAAEVLRKNVGTVKAQIHRGRAELRIQLRAAHVCL